MSIPRFTRNYELKIQALGGEVTIAPPLRINFQSDKSTRGGVNKIQIGLYNLSERNRLALVKDAEQTELRIPFQLRVGYQNSMELLFRGTVHRGSNAREGADIITTIEGLDGGHDFLNAFTNTTIGAGQDAVSTALADMPNTARGKITTRPTLTRPRVMVGNSVKLIDSVLAEDETWFIEDEQLFILKNNEVSSKLITVVNASTGLISTPTRENKLVTFQTLMNPSVKIGRLARLESTTAPHLDGVYRIDAISHQGDNYGDEWSQTCTGYLAANAQAL